MSVTEVSIKKLEHGMDLPLPSYATLQSAGLDLTAAIAEPIELAPMQRKLVPTGVAIALPDGFEAQVRPRSGLASKYGVTVANAPGTIDADYRGEIFIALVNLGEEVFIITRGMRIAQLVVARYEKIVWTVVGSLEDTSRGIGGFGSTGMQ